MDKPIILCENGDVMLFNTVQDMLNYIEPVDVRDDIYEAFDANGRILKLLVNDYTSESLRISVEATGRTSPDSLKKELVKFAKSVDESFDVSGDSLEAILEKFEARFGFVV